MPQLLLSCTRHSVKSWLVHQKNLVENLNHKSSCLIRSILYNAHCLLTLQADRLKVLFDALPKNMEPLDISAVAAKWGYAKLSCLYLIRKAALVRF